MRRTPSAICSGLYAGNALKSYVAGVNSAALTALQVARRIAAILWSESKRLRNKRWHSERNVFNEGSGSLTDRVDDRRWLRPVLEIHFRTEFDAAIHTGAIGSRLDRVP